VEEFSLNGVVLQNMRLGDAAIAAGLLQEPSALLEHLLEGLSAVSQSLSLSHLDLL
jgi:hypothetical protein